MSNPHPYLPRSTPLPGPNPNPTSNPPPPPPPSPHLIPSLTPSENAHLVRIIKIHLKFFLLSLGVLQVLEVGRRGLRSTRSKGVGRKPITQSLSHLLHTLLKPLRPNIRTALFLSLYPALFRIFNLVRLRRSSRVGLLREPLRSASSIRSGFTTSTATTTTPTHPYHPGILRSARLNIETPTLLLGPLCLLLPLGWLTQLNLYSTTAAGLAVGRYLSGRIEKGEMTWDGWVRGLGLGRFKGSTVGQAVDEDEDGKEEGYRPYWMPRTSTDKLGSNVPGRRGPLSTYSSTVTLRSNKPPKDDVLVMIRDALSGGGSWWLFSLSQGWLLYTAVFEGDCFPSSYRKGIISRSRRYVPTTQSLNLPPSQASLIPHPSSILSLLPVFAHSPYPHPSFPLPRLPGIQDQYASFLTLFDVAHRDHTKAICSVLHPLEPSCTRNYVKAVGDALPSAVALIGGWSGLTTLLRWRKFSRNPAAAFVKWIKATARGAAMIALSISTAWVWVCAFQRILAPTTLPRARFAIGGILAGCWILLVPSSRRLELGMYTFRLSLASLWKVGLKKGWWKYRSSIRFLPFAMAMTLLTMIKRRDPVSVDGWVGRTVKYLDQEVDRVKREDEIGGGKTGV